MVWNFLERSVDFNKITRQNNQRRRIIKLLLQYQELSIPELCHFLELSIPTGTKLVEEFESQSLLINAGKRESSGGRRPATYMLNPNIGYLFSIEILLNSLKINVLNLDRKSIFVYESNSFDIKNKKDSLDLIASLIPKIIKDLDLPFDKILGVGIGITGRVNAKKGISYSFLNLEIPLTEYLSNIWRIPVFIENDTHLLALAEIHYGLAKVLTNVISVNLSKGLAVSVISNSHLQTGHSGFAGELGHIFAEYNNKLCVCGKTGCLETLVSGLALEASFFQKTGESFDYKRIFTHSTDHDFPLSDILHAMGEQLGKSLAVLIDLLNPELIIVGGGFMPVLKSMRFAINKGINLHSLPQLASDCEIKISTLGDSAPMFGAFALVTENLLTT
jgi:predicted NBD/HSP70 family sugar kinase